MKWKSLLAVLSVSALLVTTGCGSQIPPIFASPANNGGNFKIIAIRKGTTLNQELIDGPIIIARCVESGESCALNADKASCTYHHIFNRLSIDVARKLEGISIKDVIDKNYTLS